MPQIQSSSHKTQMYSSSERTLFQRDWIAPSVSHGQTQRFRLCDSSCLSRTKAPHHRSLNSVDSRISFHVETCYTFLIPWQYISKQQWNWTKGPPKFILLSASINDPKGIVNDLASGDCLLAPRVQTLNCSEDRQDTVVMIEKVLLTPEIILISSFLQVKSDKVENTQGDESFAVATRYKSDNNCLSFAISK